MATRRWSRSASPSPSASCFDTFFVRTLLVPSVVVLLGRWNWWPSKLCRRDAAAGEEEAGAPESVLATGKPELDTGN
ncbi:MAG: MMPL family transporter [Thermoleophilia bacterium]